MIKNLVLFFSKRSFIRTIHLPIVLFSFVFFLLYSVTACSSALTQSIDAQLLQDIQFNIKINVINLIFLVLLVLLVVVIYFKREYFTKLKKQRHYQKLERAIDTSSVAICITDKYGILEYANTRFNSLDDSLFNDKIGLLSSFFNRKRKYISKAC